MWGGKYAGFRVSMVGGGGSEREILSVFMVVAEARFPSLSKHFAAVASL